MGMDHQHRRINHSANVYVMGDVHTKHYRRILESSKTRDKGGVYHSVSQKYLQTYLDEYSFRYNRREKRKPYFPRDFGSGFRKGVVEAFCTSRRKSDRVNGRVPPSVFLAEGFG